MRPHSNTCPHVGKCGGCPVGHLPHVETLEQKLAEVRPFLSMAEIDYSPTSRVRDRVDLIWQNVGGSMRLGLYGLGSEREVVALSECQMMSETLEKWFLKFSSVAPPIQKGSVRLRVSPSGERGVWLDFANQDVKTLFEEKSYLKFLSDQAVVEIGQRRKTLSWVEGQPKLRDPDLKPWFETYDQNGVAIPLWGVVGGFSQTGFSANRALVNAVLSLAKKSGVTNWQELFGGNGNFGLALAGSGFDVEMMEMDELALQGMARSLENVNSDMKSRLRFQRQDVYLKSKTLNFDGKRALLVDPPRAGLREVIDVLKGPGDRPPYLLYVSCFVDSLARDHDRLQELGYRAVEARGVDQFPYSNHCEWVVLYQFE